MSDLFNSLEQALGQGHVQEAQQIIDSLRAMISSPEEAFQLQFYQAWLEHVLAMQLAEKADFFSHLAVSQEILQGLISQTETIERLRARAYNLLGVNYYEAGNYEEARNAYTRALQLYRGIDGGAGDKRGECRALHNIGIANVGLAHRQRDNYLIARDYFRDSLAISTEFGYVEQQAKTLNELGAIAKELYEWDNALTYYHQSLEIWQRSDINNKLQQGRALNNIGEVYLLLGRLEGAMEHFVQAHEMFQGKDTVEESDVLVNLGFLLDIQNQAEAAHENYRLALNLAKGEIARSHIYYRLGNLYERHDDLCQAKEYYKDAIDCIESARSGAKTENTRISVMGIRHYVYDAMVLVCIRLDELADAFTYVEKARARAFLDSLGGLESQQRSDKDQPLPAQEIQARLLQQQALIEFYITGATNSSADLLKTLPRESKERLQSLLTPSEQLLAFVVTHEEKIHVTTHQQVRRLAIQYFQTISSIDTDSRRRESVEHWHRLDEILFAPVRPYLQDKKHIFIVAHAMLHRIPLHALARTGMITEHFTTISYAPSASILFEKILRNLSIAKQAIRFEGCLAIGVNRDKLKYSEAEADNVCIQMKRRSVTGNALKGPQATVEEVLKEMVKYDLLHFSCHGEFDRADAMKSGLKLFDRLLTASDISKATLKAKLITLSACLTAAHDLGDSDELFGLTRAFFQAGVEVILVSLAKVYELPTRIFMERFYDVWLGGASVANAFMDAQKYMREMTFETLDNVLARYQISPDEQRTLIQELRESLPTSPEHPFNHPSYWGAFLLIGNPMLTIDGSR